MQFLIFSDDENEREEAIRAESIEKFSIVPTTEEGETEWVLWASPLRMWGADMDKFISLELFQHRSQDFAIAVRDQILETMSDRPSQHRIVIADVAEALRPIYEPRQQSERITPDNHNAG